MNSTPEGTTTLSLVVPATNRPESLGDCLAAIQSGLDTPDELIVVERPAGAGPAAARNLGARSATKDVIVFIDADVAIAADALQRVRHAFTATPDLVGLFGSYDDSPADPGIVSTFRNLLHHHVHQEGAGKATTFWAGLGAVRRAAFLEVGGFDERRYSHPSVEDIDLGMRLVARGARIELVPDIQGKHLKRWDLLDMVRTDLFRRGIPWVRLLLASGSSSRALNLTWRNRVSVATSLAIVAALGTRRYRLAVPPFILLVALNRSFYALVLRKAGPRAAAAAIPLHVVHQLTAAAAVPAGLVGHLISRRPRERSAL